MSLTDFDARANALIARMNLSQKLGQMTQPERLHITPDELREFHIGSVLSGGGSVPGDNALSDWVAMNDDYWQASSDDLGIPLLYGVDAIHGHNNVRGAVVFPHNIGLGAANDPDLIRRIGVVTAREVLATGVEWTFAPTLAVVRDDRWGRSYEGYSEDPEIVTQYAAQMVTGLQGELGADSVVACAKHWVGDGGTGEGVDQGETALPESELQRLHIAPYREAIGAGVLTVMASYNSWNDEKCHGHRYLLTGVLKEELGFEGFVISDWDGTKQVATDYADAVVKSVNAGVDMFMVPLEWKAHLKALHAGVTTGRVPMSRIDDAVRRILRVKLAYGLFDRPRPAERPWSGHASFGSPAHRDVAREAVRKSLVLLKNDRVLPLRTDARVLVAGKNADDRGHLCGGFTLEWQGVSGNAAVAGGTSIWEGIQALSPRAVLSAQGDAAGRFDVAIVVIGETPYAEGMGDIRSWGPVAVGSGAVEPSIASDPAAGLPAVDPGPGPGRLEPYGDSRVLAALHPEDLAVIQRISARGIPVVTVLISGRPMVAEAELASSQAFVAAWLPGTEGGGVAEVLFGRYDFTGRLSFSWPARDADAPNRGDVPDVSRFPYGFGLSYA